MSKFLFTVRVIIAHSNQLLEEHDYQLTAEDADEVHDLILDDCRSRGVKIRNIRIENATPLPEEKTR